MFSPIDDLPIARQMFNFLQKRVLSGNLATKWKRFIWNYSKVSWLEKEPDSTYKTFVFLSIIGEEAYNIYEGLKFSNEEGKEKLEVVMMKFTEFFVGETLEVYEA